MDLHQNKTWHQRGILAQFNNSGPPPSQLQDLSVDVNADSLLVRSDLRWRYSTAKRFIKDVMARPATQGTSTAPCECV